MTSDVLTLSRDLTAAQAISRLRSLAPDAETPYYLFVVDKDEHLLGNVSLRNLVTAAPDRPLGQIMDTQVIKVDVDTSQEEVVGVIRKYNLLAVPVVDRENRLQGMVTVNDIVDVIHQEATENVAALAGTSAGDVEHTVSGWQVVVDRVAGLLAAIVGGGAAALVLRAYSGSLFQALPLTFFLPILVLVVGGFVAQTRVVAGLAAGEGGVVMWRSVGRETELGLLVGGVTGLLVMLLALAFTGSVVLGLVLGISVAIVLPVTGAVGSLLPGLLKRAGANPAWISGAVLDPFIAVLSVLIYLTLATYLIQHLT
jgi:magnesium transporter